MLVSDTETCGEKAKQVRAAINDFQTPRDARLVSTDPSYSTVNASQLELLRYLRYLGLPRRKTPFTRLRQYPCKHDNLHLCSATPTTSTHNEHSFETDECDDNGRAKRWQTHWRRCDLSNLVFIATIVNWWYVMIELRKSLRKAGLIFGFFHQ